MKIVCSGNTVCQLFWNTFEMACFVQAGVYRIGVNCMRTIKLHNNKQMNAIVNFRMDNDCNMFVTKMNFHVFLYFLDTEKPLVFGRPWDFYWIKRSTILSTYHFRDICVNVTQVDCMQKNIMLHDIDNICISKRYLTTFNSILMHWCSFRLYI